MKCILCDQPIQDYHKEFNQLKLDKSKTVDICSNCVGKFVNWQQAIFIKLYPTKQAKKLKKNK